MFRSAINDNIETNVNDYVVCGKPDLISVDQLIDHLISGESSDQLFNDNFDQNITQKRKTSLKCSRNQSSPRLPPPIPSTRVTTSSANSKATDTSSNNLSVWKVIYGLYKPNKKHKNFSSDGFVCIEASVFTLYSIEGKRISSQNRPKDVNEIHSGTRMVFGSQEVEFDDEVCPQDFKSGVLFTN